MLIDSHAHLDMLADVDGILRRAQEAGVGTVVTIGVDAATNEHAFELAGAHDRVFATAGLHPHDAKDRTDDLMSRIVSLAAEPKVVGIGEAGLDYFYDNSPREQQRAVFAEQIRIAAASGKALVIHSRDAWDETFSILEAEGVPSRVVFHCFSGGPAEAERAVAIGAHLSFSGIVTFPNAADLRAAAAATPLEKILVETDSPFLTPVPHRGKKNEPAFVRHVVETIAAVRNMDADTVARATTANASAVFSLPS